ncbi:MAG: nucleotidyltransferase domain-containing protein [Nanoarchaeota archaeon]
MVIQLLLENPDNQFSIRQIARALKKSYTLTYHNIQDLCKRAILAKRDLPPAQIITLHEKVPTLILTRIEQTRMREFLEKNEWCRLYLNDVLKASPHPFFVIIVFGSYAKGAQTTGSDLDLLTIVPHEEDIDMFETATNQFSKTKKNVITITADSFIEMIQNPKTFNVGNEAKKNHIILYNAETFYQFIERAK